MAGLAPDEAPDTPSDAELLAAVAGGDEDAVSNLYDRYAARMYGLALRMTGDPATAEEAVQEAFVSIWRAAETYDRTRSAPQTWLLTIARNRTLDLVRRGKRVPVAAGEQVQMLAEREDADPHEMTETRLLIEEVRRALERLNPPLRQAVEMTYYAGYTHKEAAERLGIPLGTVKSRLRLAIRHLGRIFAQGGAGS